MKRAMFLSVYALLFGMLLPLHGHSDTSLKLKEGVLKGLPKEFRPAGFDFEKKELTLKGEKLAMPKILKAIFTEEVWEQSDHVGEVTEWPPKGVFFSASWYHGPSDLPPYLLINVSPKEVSYRYEIMVDMEKVEIRNAKIWHIYEKSEVPFPIDLTEPKERQSKDTKWTEIMGKWRGQGMIVEFKEDTIVFDEVWNDENKVWKVSDSQKLNIAKVILDDGSTDTLGYERNGDLLSAGGLRGYWGILAKLGSKADLDAQRRNSEIHVMDEEGE